MKKEDFREYVNYRWMIHLSECNGDCKSINTENCSECRKMFSDLMWDGYTAANSDIKMAKREVTK